MRHGRGKPGHLMILLIREVTMSIRTAIFTILISIPVVPATAFYVALVMPPMFGA